MQFISTKAHTAIGIVVGAALLLAPMLFGFADVGGAAVLVPQIIGAIIIVSELTTTSEWSPIKLVPMRMHIIMDCLLGAILLLSPWLFGFSNEEMNAWLPHVIVGILIIGYALATKVGDAKEAHI